MSHRCNDFGTRIRNRFGVRIRCDLREKPELSSRKTDGLLTVLRQLIDNKVANAAWPAVLSIGLLRAYDQCGSDRGGVGPV